jgi:hypothetical protein
MVKEEIIVKEQEQERDCRSDCVMVDELPEKKHAWFYMRNNSGEAA